MPVDLTLNPQLLGTPFSFKVFFYIMDKNYKTKGRPYTYYMNWLVVVGWVDPPEAGKSNVDFALARC